MSPLSVDGSRPAGVATTRLRLAEGGPLGHALVARVASGAGVPALAIKGPIAGLQGLRAPRDSADVDVLVHPTQLAALRRAMLAVGWREAVRPSSPTMSAHHAINLLHDHWPVGIDLHHAFPGFLAEPGAVFDLLWARREVVTLAGAPVPAVDVVGQAAILGLHLLRCAPGAEGEAFADLLARASARLGPDGTAALVELATATDATDTLRPLLLGLGAPADALAPTRDRAALLLWRQRTLAAGSVAWLVHLRATPAWQWPRVARHAVMLTDEEIRAIHGGAAGGAGLARLRLRRVGRFARGLPATVSAYRQVRSVGPSLSAGSTTAR